MMRLEINGRKYTPKLILFDVDGTLIDDTHRYSKLGKTRYKLFIENASERAAEEWARLSGVNPTDWSIDPGGPISKAPRRDDLSLAAGALYLEGINWFEARALADEIYEKADVEQRKKFKPKLYEGTREKLRELRDAGYELGIATNGVTSITEELMDDLGLLDFFSVIVGADLVENSKPAPDMIIYACNAIGHQAADCMYVGDQLSDMKAAKGAAVLLSLGVRNTELNMLADEVLELIKDIQIV